MLRIIPLFCALLVAAELAAETTAGIDLSTLERPAGLQLSYQTRLEEQAAKRNVRKALDMIEVGRSEAETEDYFSKFADKTIDKSAVRQSGAKKIRDGKELLQSAAESLQAIYEVAAEQAQYMAEASSTGLLYEWTSLDGRKLNAKFVELADNKMTVVNNEGTEFIISLDQIKEEDRIVAEIMQSGVGYNDNGFLEAVSSGSLYQVENFNDAGFKPSIDIHGDAIGASIREHNLSMLDHLIDLGLDVNAFTQDGYTPLSIAVQEEESVTVSTLLGLGAKPFQADTIDPKFNPLEWAINMGDSSIISRLTLTHEQELSEFMISIVQFSDKIAFKPVDIEIVKELKAVEEGKKISNEEMQALKLSIFGLEPTITDLEKIIVDHELRPLTTWYYAYDFYKHTIDQNQEDIDPLISLWEEHGRDGDNSASYSLALAYINGWWNLSDTDRAVRLLEGAAEKKHTRSMILLGDIILEGIHLDNDANKAYDYYQSAAEMNDLLGMARLGECYEKGIHVAKSPRKAFVWYERASAGGLTEGMYQLANYLKDAKGIYKDLPQAYEWYKKAADRGHLESLNQLAVCYSSGTGVDRNPKKAFQLFSKASSQGHIQARANLAVCYAKGLGVGVDQDKAARLQIEVANSNDSAAKDILKLLVEPTDK